MELLKDIENYLVLENGVVKEHHFLQDIILDDHHLIINEDAKLQIIYRTVQESDWSFQLTVNSHLNVDLVEVYEASCQCSFNKTVVVHPNSTVIRYVENGTNDHVQLNIHENVKVHEQAFIKCAYVELNDYSTLMEVKYDLLGEGANANLRLASLSKDQEKKKYKITLHHQAPNTFGDMDNYGIVQSQATLIIDGVGRIDKGQYLSSTHQTNKIIVFDPRCVAQANPYLYIDEYDVKASHGASVGKIDEDHLYYLQSRGLSKHDAMHLVTYGYLLPVLEFITVDSLKERFSQVLKDKVGL